MGTTAIYAYDLFISHQSADKLFAQRIAGAVESDVTGSPLRVFLDSWDIKPGADIALELERALQASRYVAVVLTPEALTSGWVSMERSTSIVRDPAARSRTLIPLLLRDCELPDMLRRIRHIDFRRSRDFARGLEELIDVLRGREPERTAPDSILFREDAALLLRHRVIFDRPAFQTPCIHELFLRELSEAIDGAMTAINTGTLTTRAGHLLAQFPERQQYRTPAFREAFALIGVRLSDVKRLISEFESILRAELPRYEHHANFNAMIHALVRSTDSRLAGQARRIAVARCLELMDGIDVARNDILSAVNRLLESCGELGPFRTIALSSDLAREMGIEPSPSAVPAVDDDRDDASVSHLSNVLREIEQGVERAKARGDLVAAEEIVMSEVRRDRTQGRTGEEARYCNVRQFPSGRIVGLIGVWPGQRDRVYVIVVDEKFPEHFALFVRSFESADAAREAWEGLDGVPGRGEEQSDWLGSRGWTPLLRR